jgi:3-oxoacyl-[acyl-carrier protein] reductase
MKKIAVITGASRGIGYASAKELAFCGFGVVINYKNNKLLAENLALKINSEGGTARAVRADVSDFDQAVHLIESASELGEINVLVNNAGASLQKIFQDVSADEWHKLFDLNIGGVINCSSAAVKKMIPQKHGKIINISSIWGIYGAATEVHYSASKAAVIGFTKALARELGPSGIQVNCVAPGIIEKIGRAHV